MDFDFAFDDFADVKDFSILFFSLRPSSKSSNTIAGSEKPFAGLLLLHLLNVTNSPMQSKPVQQVMSELFQTMSSLEY